MKYYFFHANIQGSGYKNEYSGVIDFTEEVTPQDAINQIEEAVKVKQGDPDITVIFTQFYGVD
jgi:hypothetical protein